jgi:hypothetical protein
VAALVFILSAGYLATSTPALGDSAPMAPSTATLWLRGLVAAPYGQWHLLGLDRSFDRSSSLGGGGPGQSLGPGLPLVWSMSGDWRSLGRGLLLDLWLGFIAPLLGLLFGDGRAG